MQLFPASPLLAKFVRPLSVITAITVGITVTGMACTRNPLPPLAAEAPVLAAMGAPKPAAIESIEVSMRTPSDPAWRIRAEKRGVENWELTYRSDEPTLRDRADARFIDHFLEVLSTFSAESKADAGSDSTFGFSPYRVEIRLRAGDQESILLFGDPVSSQIYFRRELGGKVGRESKTEQDTWLGRGALILFLGNLQNPGAFQYKSIFLEPYEVYDRIELEKKQGADRGRWILERVDGSWLNQGRSINGDQAMIVEKLLRQRFIQLVSVPVDLPRIPDWTLRLSSKGQTETVAITFTPGHALAVNPARSKSAAELYPEFAGALRAFTQSRFTPDKSGTK